MVKRSLIFGIFLSIVVFSASFVFGSTVTNSLGFSFDAILRHEKRPAVIGETSIIVLISDTKKKRTEGLSGFDKLGQIEGMFFVFPENDRHGIWVKDMNFPLDIIWLNDHKEIIFIEKDVKPSSYPKVFVPDKPSKYVIEFNAGFVERHKLRVGDVFTSI